MPLCLTGAKKHLVLGSRNLLPGTPPAGSARLGSAQRAAPAPLEGTRYSSIPPSRTSPVSTQVFIALNACEYRCLTPDRTNTAKRGEEEGVSSAGPLSLRRLRSARRRVGAVKRSAERRPSASEVTASERTRCFQPGKPTRGGGTRCPVNSQALAQGPARPGAAAAGSAKARRAGMGGTRCYNVDVAEGS